MQEILTFHFYLKLPFHPATTGLSRDRLGCIGNLGVIISAVMQPSSLWHDGIFMGFEVRDLHSIPNLPFAISVTIDLFKPLFPYLSSRDSSLP